MTATDHVPPMSRPGVHGALASGCWLTPVRARSYLWLTLILSVVGAAGWLAAADGLVDAAGLPIGADFMATYAAGAAVRAGAPLLPYDWQAFPAFQQTILDTGTFFPWVYPPVMLLLAAALAALPYGAALGLYLGATLAAYLAVVARLAGRAPGALLAAAAFPAVFLNVGNGQNGFLTTALLGGAFAALPRRPLLAGLLFGLLAYKPQIGLLIPVALVAIGAWRTIAVATVTVAATTLVATAVFGVEINQAFLAGLGEARTHFMDTAGIGFNKLQSPFGQLMLIGTPSGLAYGIQAATTLALAVVVAAVWRGPYDHASRASVLVLAIPLATPYGLDYDLAILAIPLALRAVRGFKAGFAPYEITLLAALWVLPLVARSLAAGTGVVLAPLLIGATLVVIVADRAQARRSAVT